MKITEKSKDGLSVVYNITVEVAELNESLDAKIKEIAPTLNLKGFRKGKVPTAHVKRLYGKGIMGDLLNELVQKGIDQAVNDNNVRPASNPEVGNVDNVDAILDGKAALVFDVSMDILPEFEVVDVATLSITRPVTEATEEEVTKALEEIAANSKAYEAKTGKAKNGDAVICDFVGKIDGVEFQGGAANDAQVVLGSNTFIPGFEDALVGVKAEDETVINVTFPADYGVVELAGKAATFDIKVKEVKAPKESKIDDELAKTVGLETLDSLKDAVKADIERQFASLSRTKAKRSLLDALDASHSFELPPKMVEAEFDAIWQQVQADKAQGNVDPDDEGKSEDELKGEYKVIAERRVRLGLVLAEIGRVGEVQITDQELQGALFREASRYPGQERQVLEFFQKNPNMMAQLRAPLYEEKVVDYVLSKAKVDDVKVTREELEAEDEEPQADAKPAKAKKAAPKAKKEETSEEKPKKAAKAKDEAASEEKPKKAPAKKAAKAKE
ncbi:trigger factor [Pseudaquidulcibacter saccharophilus]|uniref:trigger factor n=1 Tax=Pseudaquidulcibacter saccharophilus TaxID=2831900 RepID=UPI001EFEF317|nr:trigger factor [Pseudaquidulcibacter saccharophilus]